MRTLTVFQFNSLLQKYIDTYTVSKVEFSDKIVILQGLIDNSLVMTREDKTYCKNTIENL